MLSLSLISKITVEPVVFFYVFAIFAEYVVMEDVIYVRKCVQHLNMTDLSDLHICTKELKLNKSSSASDIISKETNEAMRIYNGILYLASIISSFIAATYADRNSKFLPIIIPVIGSSIVQLIILFILFIDNHFLLFMHNGELIIFLCSLISGITGGTSTLISSCFAYTAEKCSQSNRTSRIAIIEACLFAGGFFGFLLTGTILRSFPDSLLRYTFNFGMFLLMHLFLGAYLLIRKGMFTLPEDREPNHWSSNCFLLLISVLRTIFRKRDQRPIILLILISFIFISYWNTAITTTLFVFAKSPLNWPTWKYSYFNSAKFALCGAFLLLLPIVQYLLIYRFNRKPLSDSTIITIGLISRGTSIILIGLSTDTTLMLVALVTIIFAEYPLPAIRSLISKIIEPNEKAQVFVFMATLQSICFFTGGMMFPTFYSLLINNKKNSSDNVGPFNGPGLQFIVLGLLQFLTIGIFIYITKVINRKHWIRLSNENDKDEL